MPSVTLLDYTGKGQKLPGEYAAKILIYIKNTRLEQSPETWDKIDKMQIPEMMTELDAISKTIRSSWEFIDYTFQINGVTRAFTHQLVRTRTASYAQQSQRSVDMSDHIYTRRPGTVDDVDGGRMWDEMMRLLGETYKLYHQAGVPAQDCRGVLPTNILTNIAVKMNLRTVADIVGKRENLRAQGEYSEVVQMMKHEVLAVHPWAGRFLNPERTKTPAMESILRDALGKASPVDKPRINDALKELDALKGIWG